MFFSNLEDFCFQFSADQLSDDIQVSSSRVSSGNKIYCVSGMYLVCVFLIQTSVSFTY